MSRHVSTCIDISIYRCINIYISISRYIYILAYRYIDIWISRYIHTGIPIYTYVHFMYIYIIYRCIHIYTYIWYQLGFCWDNFMEMVHLCQVSRTLSNRKRIAKCQCLFQNQNCLSVMYGIHDAWVSIFNKLDLDTCVTPEVENLTDLTCNVARN